METKKFIISDIKEIMKERPKKYAGSERLYLEWWMENMMEELYDKIFETLSNGDKDEK